jgi:predicted Rossmann fold nucleotide-binding protein DprA/Smf involved in DNA uptake
LRTGQGYDDVEEALAWAALDAAGVHGGWREAVVQAGGPQAVLRRGALSSFASPARRTRVLASADIAQRLEALRPWLAAGARVVVGDELQRFASHPVCCFYGFGTGRVPALRDTPGRPSGGAPVVALVGSRQADDRWCARVERLAAACARAGAVVVSGGARGIDRAAQRAARAAGGAVIVVQGLQARPPVDVDVDPGLCWLTPYGPWRTGASRLFAERNAWIAAAADVVVVVCGSARSGTRHTIDAALRFARPIATLRADDDDPLGVIPRRLAAAGAPIIDDEDVDVAALLALPAGSTANALPLFHDRDQESQSGGQAPIDDRDAPAPDPLHASTPQPLLRLLRGSGPLLIDDAAARLCLSVRELLVDVAVLEIDGLIRRDGALLHPMGLE